MNNETRNQNQIIAMSCLYEFLTRAEMGQDIDVKDLLERNCDLVLEEIDLFVSQVVVKAIKNRQEIINSLQVNMTKWKFPRLNRIAQAILLLSVAHYRYLGDVDRGVVIDIAVRLAKRFLDADEYKFINAVLDKTL
ncbi:MAG: transcription antitermination factor NusB [Bacilli bacterium]|jgi:transcription antitermination factor NusB